MAYSARRIVVSGATGKQGGALISALLAQSSRPVEIYALTRNKSSKSAQSLASNPNIHVIQGDFSDPPSIFAQVEKPWGFFSVTNPMNAAKEEAQGKAMTKAAIDAGVKHIVFTATDRGNDSDNDPTVVPHFASKYAIEQDIKERSKQSGGSWTFLRPVAFYENLSNDFLGKGFVSMWRLNGLDNKIKFISTKDIGRVAADAFLDSGSEQYRNTAIPLAGDEISLEDMKRIFEEEMGQTLPETFSVVAKGLKWALHEHLGIMYNWFKTDGFGADVGAVRKAYPFVKDFRTWLRTESAWRQHA